MDILLGLPVLLKVIGSLVFFVLVQRLTKSLIIALASGALCLALWSGHDPAAIARIVWETVSSADSLFLFAVIFAVIGLSNQMEKTGLLAGLVAGLRQRLPSRLAMAALPAVIGLLPMPGGAYFSAPLVDECDEEKKVEPMLKTNINFWFRHIWEYWWPLYPGVVASMAPVNFNLPLWLFIPVQLPFWGIAIITGYFFFLRKLAREPLRAGNEKNGILLPFLPILVIAAAYAIVKIWAPAFDEINSYLPFLTAILAAIAVLGIVRPLPAAEWRKIFFSVKTLKVLGIIVLATVYSGFIQARLPSGSLLVEQMRLDMDLLGIPMLLLVTILPFTSGLATGITLGFVGASFPIIVSLMGPSPKLSEKLATLVLAYGFGYAGIILSPVHTCLIMTNEYFKTSLAKSIGRMILPTMCILACAIVSSSLIRLAGF